MRSAHQFQCLFMVVAISLFPYFSLVEVVVHDSSSGDEIRITDSNILSQEDGELNLTWTSRTQSIPQQIEKDSIAVGDHIVLNATWNEQIGGGNVTQTMMTITDGFTFTTTRPLVPTGGYTLWDFATYNIIDWIEISGLSRGDIVDITAYASSDCDYVAYPASTSIDEYYLYANLLGYQMFTAGNPEHGTITWNLAGDTMFLGCFNYDNAVGNYTVDVKVGKFDTNSNLGNNIILDSYWLDNNNDTYEITVTAETDLNESYSFRYDNITLCNFFTPDITDIHTMQHPLDKRTYNISWSCSDTNEEEENYYELWLSDDNGTSFDLLESNFTRSWYIWNSTGWFNETYLVRVQAYSVELDSPECEFDNPPTSYWPGDYSEILSSPFDGGDTEHPPPPDYYTLDVTVSVNPPYYFNTIGNNLTVHLHFEHSIPSSFYYYVSDNESAWFHDEYFPQSFDEIFMINIDGLAIGHHNITITFTGYSFQIYIETCFIDVIGPTSLDWNSTSGPSVNLSQILFVGIVVGSISIIAAVILFSIRLKRKQVVEFVDSESLIPIHEPSPEDSTTD